MKTNQVLYILIALLFSINSLAQEKTQTVKGQIIDIDSRLPLPGATVILIDSDPLMGTASDFDGYFKLEGVPIGRQSFKLSMIGYQDAFVHQVVVGSGREVVIAVEMQETVQKLNEIKVTANRNRSEAINKMATISAQQITIESTARMAAGISDPGRTAQSYAGVASADDENNELVIRGNSPRGMLWRMEGVPIPNPNHFSDGDGGSGGGVSALSTQVLANSDFLTGAFPAEYGMALSGVFDLKLRNGNSDKREYAVQLGVLGAQLAAEGPVSKNSKASYLINYRYSTLEMLSKAGIDISGGDIVPTFQDLSYKVHLPTKKFGVFSLWGLGGLSDAGFNAIKDSSTWDNPHNYYSETEVHRLGIQGLNHNYLFKNNKSYIRTVVALSYSENEMIRDTLGQAYVATNVFNENLAYSQLNIHSFFNHKFSPRHIMRFGALFSRNGFKLHNSQYNYQLKKNEQLLNADGNANVYEGYWQWKYRINENIDLNSGIHATFQALNNDYAIEPRIGFRWKLSPKSTAKIGAGLHSKTEPVSIYLAERADQNGNTYLPNKNLKMTKASHIVAGYTWNFATDFTLKTEVYYQHLYDVPVMIEDSLGIMSAVNFRAGFTNMPFYNRGTARNYGTELSLEKHFSRNYYLLLTASLFQSKYTMPGFDERNTVFNSNYITNAAGGKEFPVGKDKQNIFSINIRTMLRGGYRTIPIDVEESKQQNKEIRIYEDAYETKAPDYFRIDLGTSFRKNNDSWAWILSLDLQNATNRLNVWDQYYSPYTQKIENYYMNGLIPILNYRVEF